MLADRVRQWEAEFIEQGIEQGKHSALEKMASSLMQTKFGGLSDSILTQLAAASADDLEQYIGRILTANSIEDVLK